MNTLEHKKYLKDFTALTNKILESEESTTEFLVKAKINTPKGKLTEFYSEDRTPIGFKIKK